LAHLVRGIDDAIEGKLGSGIEIEDETLGRFRIVSFDAPGMNF